VIDSHTAGEPTRVITGGVPEPKGQTMLEKRESFRNDYDWLRTASVCEPRGHDAIVGAMLCEPCNKDCATGVIFFNNVGCLNGCIHGTMGVAVTLLHEGRIRPGHHNFDTPVGVVGVEVSKSGTVTVENVRSFRYRTLFPVELPGTGQVRGDIAWGGNWFFLADGPRSLPIIPENIDALTEYSWAIRKALKEQNITGMDGAEIDHIELFGPPSDPSQSDSRNFVLCPGKAYDRSPCGTGTSAKLACLAADEKLKEGQTWRQAGILNTVFEGSYKAAHAGGIIPTLTGSAHITARAELIIQPDSPFAFGIPATF